ncbi:MAG: hypothetical protein DRQ88_07295 [Epsilonproteobacteria bacterium]|nr:MAG: hypothetical protein DRQ89_03120 [Campylobacterota bacterium]RLA66287.1 MAG: hypothetical protein DRQ88_07295 [Campylobacterota bacterium]
MKHRKIVNLDGRDCEKDGCSKSDERQFDKPIELQDDSSVGYRVEDYFDLSIGAGVGVGLSWDNVSTAASLGGIGFSLVPTIGTKAKVVRYADSREEVDELPRRAYMPRHAQDVLDWKTGTIYDYSVSGGIRAGIGASYAGAVSVGISYAFKGEWKYYIEKQDDGFVFVKVTKGKLHEVSGSLNFAAITSLSVSKFRNVDDAWSFRVDLNYDEGQEIYERLIRGDLVPAEKAVEEGLGLYVTRVDHIKRVSVGRKLSAGVGVPIFISKKWSQGLIHTKAIQNLYEENERYDIDLGTFHQGSVYRRIGKQVNQQKSFVATRISGDDGYTDYSGQFTWKFSTTSAWMPRVTKELKKLYKLIGFHKNLSVIFPKEKIKGYVGAKFEIDFSEDATDALMRLQQNQKGFLTQMGSMMHDSYFKKNKDSQDICKTRVCEKIWSKRIKRALTKAGKSLTNMMNFKKEGNHKGFVKSYANFAKHAFKNMFTLRAVLSSICEPIRISYKLEGESFAFKKSNLSLNGKHCLVNKLR